MPRQRLNTEQPVKQLWWLHPGWLFALVVGGTMLMAVSQSEAAYRLYGTPKYLSSLHVGLAAAAIAVFAAGYKLALATGAVPRPSTRRVQSIAHRAFWTLTILALIGYAVWMMIGLRNGFNMAMLREFISGDDPTISDYLANDIFPNWKGITTATQFGVAAVPLGVWLVGLGERQLIWPLGLLLFLGSIRAVLFSERLAIIELALPAAIVGARMYILGKPRSAWSRTALQAAPILGLGALLVFFGGSEYFRSWRYYQHEFDSFTEFTLWRISGYYSTAHNNGAMGLQTQPRYPLPYSTVQVLWLFPGLSTSPLGYREVTGVDPGERHLKMLEQFGTPELNNEGGLFQPAMDFGLGGFLLFWFASGFVSGRVYRHFLIGTLAGLTLYPLIVIGIMETPRFLYLCYTRAFPALLALAVILWLARRPPAEMPVSGAQLCN